MQKMALRTTPDGVSGSDGIGFGGGGGYATDLDLMGQAKTLVLNKHDEMWAEVKKCMSILGGVSWQGPARTAFDQLQLEVQDLHEKAMQHLSMIATGIGTSLQQYQQTEIDNQTTLKV